MILNFEFQIMKNQETKLYNKYLLLNLSLVIIITDFGYRVILIFVIHAHTRYPIDFHYPLPDPITRSGIRTGTGFGYPIKDLNPST